MAPSRRRKHEAADADGWVRVNNKEDRVAQQAANSAYERSLRQQRGEQKGEGKQDDKGHHGVRPKRPARAGDPEPGVLSYDSSDSSRCSFVYHSRLFSVSTKEDGWACYNCAMPANHESRTHCGICGAKYKEDMAPNKNGKDNKKADDMQVDPPKEADAAAAGGDKSLSETHKIPAYKKLVAELSRPRATPGAPAKAVALPGVTAADRLAAAQKAFNGATQLLKSARDAEESEETVAFLSKNVSARKTAVDKAEAAAKDAPAPAQKAPAILLENARGKLSKAKELHLEWAQNAWRLKGIAETRKTAAAKQYTDLITALQQELELYQTEAALAASEWDKINMQLDREKLAEIKVLEDAVTNLEPVVPAAVAVVPAAPAPAAPPAALPSILPLSQLAPMALPDDMELLRRSAATRIALHHLDDQEEEVRVSYPFCWGHVESVGLTWADITTLLPTEIIGDVQPKGDCTIPRRVLGALRRRLDGLATLWEVAHAMLSTEADVTTAANAVITNVMDEAKRMDSRKRVKAPETTESEN